jgi:hypothetical protein
MERTTLLVGEDKVVRAGEELEGTLILVDGDLEVAGIIDGDVILAGGTVRILDGGRITGDLRVVDGEVARLDGSVGGSLLDLDRGDLIESTEEEVAELREELESTRRALEATRERQERSASRQSFGVLGHLADVIGDLLKNLMTFLVLCVLGVLMVHFQGDRLEVVATTARRATTRSAVVGLAGGFLLVPLWIVGALALAISIIGIPVLLVWVPFFPIAAGLAALLGYLAVARNVGEWVAEQEYRGLEWIRGSNSFYTVIAGIGALMVPCVASTVVSLLGLNVLTGLLAFVGSMITLAAAAVGLGAVLLTRGGRIRPHESYFDFEEEFWVDVAPRGPEAAHADTGAAEAPPSDPEETGDPEEGEKPAEEGPDPETDGDDEPGGHDGALDTEGRGPDADEEWDEDG